VILLLFLACFAGGALTGILLAKTYLTVAAPTARQRRNHLDAIALLRTLQLTPDALDLRDRAAQTVAAFDADNRKDT
jgi:hypothetical protein